MKWRDEWKSLTLMIVGFAVLYWLPIEHPRFQGALDEALALTRWYTREHVLLCLIPAFFIAGAIGVFVSQASVMKYLGPRASRPLAYGVASVSGTVLAVCSCTVLPLFAGIYRMGAGLGPASAFLYSGPAINVLAMVLTARILGLELGLARAVGAVAFSVVIGLLMHLIFRREEQAKAEAQMAMPAPPPTRPLRQTILYFASMVGILVFANWGRSQSDHGTWHAIWTIRWWLTSVCAMGLGAVLATWFGLGWRPVTAVGAVVGILVVLTMTTGGTPTLPFIGGVAGLSIVISRREDELGEWFAQTWGFAKQILPLLLFGVLISGALLGRPGQEGLIPSAWIAESVGGNSPGANFFAAFAGAFMYFATLTEVPILQGLIGSSMGQGPALALLLAGPALSLPSMLVLRSIMGTTKTIVFVLLVVVMATLCGIIYGNFAG